MKKRLLYVGVLLTTVLVNAQQKQDSTKVEHLEEVVITDSRFKLKRENSGKTVIKITLDELQRNQGRTLAEVINTKSGIEINGSRSNGAQNLSAFIRGGNNRQVLVLIDGVQVSDPSTLTNSFDLRLLDLDQIASIEIIKGAASTLYGNSAATAVINITTKKASKKPIAANFSTSVGTNQSATETDYDLADRTNNIAINGTLGEFTYQAQFGYQHTDGLSAVAVGTEKDAFYRLNLGANLGYQFSKKFKVDAFAFQDRFTAEFDNTFPDFEDADFSSLSDQYRFGISPKFIYSKGSLTVNTSYVKIDRTIESSFPNMFKSKSLVIDAFNKYNFKDRFYTIVGVNFIKNDVAFTNNEEDVTTIDPYVNIVWISNFGLNFNIGSRLNNHSEYGSHFTYNINPSYTYKFNSNYLKFFGSYSTSFIAPNLSQLFGPFLANPDLEPETNTTLEVGSELKLTDKLRVNALYFNRKEKETVLFSGSIGYFNADEDAEAQGIEVELNTSITKQLNFNANYAFTERKEAVAIRIPKHKVNASLNYAFGARNYIGLNYQFVGDRTENDFSTFPATEVNLDSFSLVDLTFGHSLIKDRLFFSAAITNLFDEDYTEILGFTTKGRNFRLGLRLDF